MRSDDWTYLAWARAHGGALSFLLEPPPFPYFRPLNAAAWQIQGHHFGAARWPLEGLLLGLWGLAMALLYRVSARRAGPVAGLIVVVLALTTPEIRGLPNWRSWLTTVGELAGLLGAVALVRHPRAALPFGMLALGAGFKEGAWWQGALAMAALGRVEVGAAALAIYVVHAGISAGQHSAGELALAHVPGNLIALAHTLLTWGWPVALALLSLGAPRAAWRDGSARLVLAGLLGTLPALGFYLYSPYYVIEPLILLLLGLTGPAFAALARAPGPGWLLMLALAAWLARGQAWADYGENVPYQAKRSAEARALAAEAGPVRAVWADAPEESSCGLAADLVAYQQQVPRLTERPAEGRLVWECLVVIDR